MSLVDLAPFLVAFFALCVSGGGLLAIRRGYTERVEEIMGKVNTAQRSLNEVQEKQIQACQQEVQDLKQEARGLQREITAMRYAFKKQGYTIEINGEFVTLIHEQQSKQKRTMQIPITVIEDGADKPGDL
jgi:t-SNARE complex subunit (syntaxin)